MYHLAQKLFKLLLVHMLIKGSHVNPQNALAPSFLYGNAILHQMLHVRPSAIGLKHQAIAVLSKGHCAVCTLRELYRCYMPCLCTSQLAPPDTGIRMTRQDDVLPHCSHVGPKVHVNVRSRWYLNSELCLLASQSGPHIDLHLKGGSTREEACCAGVAGCSPQVLAQLTKQCGHVMMDAHHVLLARCLLSEGGHYDDPQEPANATSIKNPNLS